MEKEKKLKILQVNKLYCPFTGGIEAVVQQIAEGLCQKTDMKVLVCNEKRQTVQETLHGVNITRAGSMGMLGNLPLSLCFFRELKRQAADRDILLFHMPFPIGDLAYLFSGIRKKKVIVWWHSDIVRQKKMMFFYKPIMNRFLKRADRVIVATQGHVKGSEYLNPFQEKCVIIPYGVRQEIEEDSLRYLLERTRIREESQDAVSGEEDTEKKKLQFLFVGRLVYYKGCDILLKAFEQVKYAELVIVGSGALEEEMKRYVHEHQMGDRVYFRGNLPDEDVMKAYRDCDVFVLPSIARSEAFGLVQIEAMSYAKPVINTQLESGVPYVSLHGLTGLTVKSGNIEQMAEAMKWMVRHSKERLQMGRNARKRVEEEFLTGAMLDKIYKLCKP